MPLSSKPWYTRRRYRALALLAFPVYFCLIPSRLRVSPETTGFTEPLLPNGDVDYFGAIEQTYIHKLSPPDDNGMRLPIAALGPRALEQIALANTVPWEEMPTHERSKWWFHEQWIPLCEHMGIDPHVKPQYLDNLNYYDFLKKEQEANMEAGDMEADDHRYYDAGEKLRQKLIAAPWTAEEYPNIARWIEERSPVLDLFGDAVRKPNFACFRWRPESEFLAYVLLPDVQAQRQFGRELSIRITERLGRGNVDGAWDDVMSMLYLSRKHWIDDPFIVVKLVGSAVEAMGLEAAKVILQYGNPTPEQLERFARDLDSLPRETTLSLKGELGMGYSVLQFLCKGDKDTRKEFFCDMACSNDGILSWEDRLMQYITFLPTDLNIAGKRITEFLLQQRVVNWMISRTTAQRRHADEYDMILGKNYRIMESLWSLLRVPLIHTRSKLIADYVIKNCLSGIGAAVRAFVYADTRLEMLRLAVALKRYKTAHEKYPETLNELIPKYLDELPLEPLTGQLTWEYKLAPDEETVVLLHPSEWGENEDDFRKKNLFLRIAK
jgi:hypothetical protein